MKKITLAAAAAAISLAIPGAASAQQLPQSVIAVVDTGRILQQCTACVAANQQLQAQAQQLEQRAQALGTPLQTEQQAIQQALQAAGGNPNAQLQQRITAFQTQQQNAQRELSGRQDQLRRNQQFVLQQIDQRLNPIITQVMQQRGANIAVDRQATLAHNPAVEITDAVLALLNQQLPSVNVNAPAQQQQQQPATGR